MPVDHGSGDIDQNVVEEIVKAVDGGVETVAKVAVEHIRSFFTDKSPDYIEMVPHLALVHAFICSSIRPLRLAMLCQKSLPMLISALNLVDNTAISSETPIPNQYITLSYFSIIQSLKSANGATWISQAFDAGLLPVVLKSGARLQRLPAPALEIISQNIFKTLHQYLPLRSVLRPVARALDKVDRLNIEAGTAGPLWDPWRAFHSAAMGKLLFKEEFDQLYPSALSAAMIGCWKPKVKRSQNCLFHVFLTYVRLTHSAPFDLMLKSSCVARLALWLFTAPRLVKRRIGPRIARTVRRRNKSFVVGDFKKCSG
jgi:hypothetical protein